MAKFTIERWRCDRCGLIEDERPKLNPEVFLRAGKNYDVAAGPQLRWHELCEPCSALVALRIDELCREGDLARAQHSERNDLGEI